jgi:hypothetical protein
LTPQLRFLSTVIPAHFDPPALSIEEHVSYRFIACTLAALNKKGWQQNQ